MNSLITEEKVNKTITSGYIDAASLVEGMKSLGY